MDNLETESIENPEEESELEQPTEDTEEREEADTDEVEAEQSESEDDDSSETEDEGPELIDLDGEQVDLETVRKWKNGHLMQEDYTRKTQALADQRKQYEAKATEFDAIVSELESDLLSDPELSQEKLAELRDYDTSEYLKRKELLDARKAKIAAAKSKAAKARDEAADATAAEERQKLVQANPEWLDATGKPTEKYHADIQMMNDYLAKTGFSAEEVESIGTAKMWTVIKEAAQLKAKQAKSAALTKKVKKAPTVTKPQSKSAPKQRSAVDIMYGD